MNIRVEYSKLGKKIVEFISLAREVETEIERMEEVLEELLMFWESDANSKYYMRMMADLYNARLFLEKMRRSILDISEALQRFDDTERKISVLIHDM